MTPPPHPHFWICRCCNRNCEIKTLDSVKVGSKFSLSPNCSCLFNPDIGVLWVVNPHSSIQSSRDTVLDEIEELAEHYYRAYLDGDPYIEKTDFKKMINELHQTKAGSP